MSGTPILDRQAPLPPRTAPGTDLAVVLAIWIIAIAIVTIGLLLIRPPILRDWVLTNLRPWLRGRWTLGGIVGGGVSVLIAYYGMIAVHELGHVLAGLCVCFRFRSLRVGPLVFTRPFRVSIHRGPGAAINGVAELIPASSDNLARRGLAMVLGGPAANIISGLGVLLLPVPIGVLAGCFIAFSLANGLSDLLPFESRLGVSDGRRVRMLIGDRSRGERWLALMQLGGEIKSGVLPESLSPGFLAKATAVRDRSQDTVGAHAYAYASAFHRHDTREAAAMLETCLAYSSHAAPAVREALMSDAAVFQGRRRRRADLAEQWLASIPAKPQNAWLRSRAAAAILEAGGDVAGATRRLAEVEAAIRAFPPDAQRDTQLQLLQRWKADLSLSG